MTNTLTLTWTQRVTLWDFRGTQSAPTRAALTMLRERGAEGVTSAEVEAVHGASAARVMRKMQLKENAEEGFLQLRPAAMGGPRARRDINGRPFHEDVYLPAWMVEANTPADSDAPLHADFETRSECDLKTAGASVYAQHPTTEVLILSWKIDARRGRWFPGMPIPQEILAAKRFAAHNAAFEREIWRHIMVARFGWPEIEVDRWICSMEIAAYHGLPMGLDKAVVAARVAVRKDMEGHRLMLKHCKPRKPRKGEDPSLIHWHEDPAERAKIFDYCDSDVDAEEALLHQMPAPIPLEQEVIKVNRQINSRGVRFDKEAVEGAMKIAHGETLRLNADMRRATNGAIKTTDQVQAILAYASERGVDLADLRAATVREMVADEEEPGELDGVEPEDVVHPQVKAVLLLRAEAAKASIKKLRAMVKAVGTGDRAFDMHAYCGAARTGRWSGRRVQVHNMFRGKIPDSVDEDVWYDALATGDRDYFASLLPEGMSVMDGLRVSMRGFIVPLEDGHVILAADESQIEARGLPWLAGQESTLNAFRRYDAKLGPDIYAVQAADMGQSDRQIGKVAVLGCGYQAGKRALVPFARNYGFNLTEDEADDIVQAWRVANPMIVNLWREEEQAAKWAINHPGVPVSRGRTGSWYFDPGRDALLRFLPSGRPLAYRRARIERKMTPWGKETEQIVYDANFFAKGQPGVFARVSTYGGKIVENIDQAMCRDILAVGLCRAARHGLECFLHVHDEQAISCPEWDADRQGKLLVAAMTDPISWLPDFPMASSLDVLRRYRKT